MVTFLSRRVLASLVVLLAASYLVYILACNSGDPLADLRTSTLRNKDTLIENRIRLLNLDVPPPLRYFIWFGGVLKLFIGQLDLGKALNGQAVTHLLGAAMGSTLQLVTTATVLAIFIGIAVGITTALRQYTAYDYTVTFMSFLFFSLPIFWLAVMLKQYLAIGFNDFLQDPVISPVSIIVLAGLAGVVWLGILGGNWRKRLITFVVAAAATAVALAFFSVTKWFSSPSLGPVVVLILSIGIALLVTLLSTGLENKKALYTSLTVAALGIVLYYPLMYLFEYPTAIWTILGLAVLAIAVGAAIGYFWGGVDRWVSARTGAITAFMTGVVILVDRFMHSWNIYANSSFINGRPIATIGSQTPDLVGSFWVEGLDNFTHLLLPTAALLLASLAGYTRYSRASLLDVMNQDYIRTARAKGLNERTVVMRHAFRNALIPITTIVALDFGALIGGAVITERVFGWSGMGALFQNALPVVDVNPIMGVFLVTGIAAIVFNILADLIYSALDPRIRVTA
ncbi:MAG: ABC transporter permease [Lacisediminihabitans sp.]